MTWDLAESGKDFITTIVNRNDVVPSLGRVSTAKLRTEVPLSTIVEVGNREVNIPVNCFA